VKGLNKVSKAFKNTYFNKTLPKQKLKPKVSSEAKKREIPLTERGRVEVKARVDSNF